MYRPRSKQASVFENENLFQLQELNFRKAGSPARLSQDRAAGLPAIREEPPPFPEAIAQEPAQATVLCGPQPGIPCWR